MNKKHANKLMNEYQSTKFLSLSGYSLTCATKQSYAYTLY